MAPHRGFLELVHMKFPGWPVIRHGSWDAGVLMEQSTNPMIEMEFEWAIYLLNGWFVVAKFDYQRHPLWFAFRLVQSRLKSVLTVLLCRHIRYPLVISHSYWTWPSKKNDLPSKNGGSFHSYVNVYQRVSIGIRLICREVSLDHGTCINMLGSQHKFALKKQFHFVNFFEHHSGRGANHRSSFGPKSNHYFITKLGCEIVSSWIIEWMSLEIMSISHSITMVGYCQPWWAGYSNHIYCHYFHKTTECGR